MGVISTIEQLLDHDKDQIDANLNEIKEYLTELNQTFASYDSNLSEMESNFIKNKMEDDMGIIKDNCVDILEQIHEYDKAVNKVFSAIEEQDGAIK